jgi:hypothetical protein
MMRDALNSLAIGAAGFCVFAACILFALSTIEPDPSVFRAVDPIEQVVE